MELSTVVFGFFFMPVTAYEPDGSRITGIIVLENQTGQGQYQMREAINAEIIDILPSTYNQLVAVAHWGLHVNVRSWNREAVKTIAGFPTRAQFGQMTYVSGGTFINADFLKHERQGFQPQRCIVQPFVYSDLPYQIADITVFGEVQGIAAITQFLTGGERLVTGYDSYIGATGFWYDLNATVNADFSIPYYVKAYDDNPGHLSGQFVILNY